MKVLFAVLLLAVVALADEDFWVLSRNAPTDANCSDAYYGSTKIENMKCYPYGANSAACEVQEQCIKEHGEFTQYAECIAESTPLIRSVNIDFHHSETNMAFNIYNGTVCAGVPIVTYEFPLACHKDAGGCDFRDYSYRTSGVAAVTVGFLAFVAALIA